MVPQRQEPVVPLMLGAPPSSRAGSWLMISALVDGSLGVLRYRGTRAWSVRGPPMGRPLKHSRGSGGQVRAPCPFAVIGTDNFEPCVAIPLPRVPELGRGDRFRQMQQLGTATEVEEHADLPRLR